MNDHPGLFQFILMLAVLSFVGLVALLVYAPGVLAIVWVLGLVIWWLRRIAWRVCGNKGEAQ